MNFKIGFIGCGNMGKAILEGLFQAKMVDAAHVIVSNKHPEKLKDLKSKYGFKQADNKGVAIHCDIIILACKPKDYHEIIRDIKMGISADCIIVAIAAGYDIATLTKLFEKNVKIARVMPNTPSKVGMGMSGACFSSAVSEQEQLFIQEMFASIGKCQIIREEEMNAVIGVSGSAPAYCYMFMQALLDSALEYGMSKKDARLFIAQTLKGAASVVEQSDLDIACLIDEVCSPNGTTIEAVKVLENKDFKGLIHAAVDACIERNKAMELEYARKSEGSQLEY